MQNSILKLRSDLLVWLTHKMALPLLKLIRKPERFPYSVENLQEFPDGTLGKDLVNFLQAKELHLLPYYARHDIKHILLGYDTTDEGEGSLQCFYAGQQAYFIPGTGNCCLFFCNHARVLGQICKSL